MAESRWLLASQFACMYVDSKSRNKYLPNTPADGVFDEDTWIWMAGGMPTSFSNRSLPTNHGNLLTTNYVHTRLGR